MLAATCGPNCAMQVIIAAGMSFTPGQSASMGSAIVHFACIEQVPLDGILSFVVLHLFAAEHWESEELYM
eukprot:2002680-Heterocapsa_arctica.AAC.1